MHLTKVYKEIILVNKDKSDLVYVKNKVWCAKLSIVATSHEELFRITSLCKTSHDVEKMFEFRQIWKFSRRSFRTQNGRCSQKNLILAYHRIVNVAPFTLWATLHQFSHLFFFRMLRDCSDYKLISCVVCISEIFEKWDVWNRIVETSS